MFGKVALALHLAGDRIVASGPSSKAGTGRVTRQGGDQVETPRTAAGCIRTVAASLRVFYFLQRIADRFPGMAAG
jgi:hypothetical protein